MFHINHRRILKEEREKGTATVSFYEGVCLTCEYSPDRENRAACPKADFFTVNTYISKMAGATKNNHLCKNWLLCSEITSCFKKNQPTETQPPQQSTFNGKFNKYNRDKK